jgi:hypothetical protein
MTKAQELLNLTEMVSLQSFNNPVELIQFLADNLIRIQTRVIRELGEDEVYWEFRLKGSLKIYKCIIKERFAWYRDPILRQKTRQFE